MAYNFITKDRVGTIFSQGSDYGNVSDFINDCRLTHARCLLMEQPDMSIVDIAVASGFALRTSFTRNFKQKYGLTPTEFRSQQSYSRQQPLSQNTQIDAMCP